jgi:FkbM family methyltransferase
VRQLLKPHYVWRPAQAFQRLAQALRRDAPGPRTVTLPWGLRMRVDPGEDIGRSIWQLGLYDLAVCEALWRLVSPGDLALDVGANIGCMTGLMALRAGPSGEVRAFEPHPQVCADLRENADLFRIVPIVPIAPIAPIQVIPLAVSDAAGTATLYSGDHFALNHGLASFAAAPGPSLAVATTTLDEALGGRSAAVVKIDVEGSELRVVRGARQALREGRIRHIIYEAYPQERSALEETMRDLGYSVHALGRSFFGPLLAAPGEEPRLPGYEAPSFLATRDPETAAARLRPRGWQVLTARRLP